MEKLKNNLPMILLIVFELAVGILLLINGELFTKVVTILFGIALMAVGVVYAVRSFSDRDNGVMSWIALAISVVTFFMGLMFTFFSRSLVSVLAFIAVVFGLIMVISAVFKVKAYFDIKRLGLAPSAFTLISAVVSFLIGALIIINPFKSIEVLWVFTGICLIVQAALDIVMLIFKFRLEK